MPWVCLLTTPSQHLVTRIASFPFCLISLCIPIGSTLYLLIHCVHTIYISICLLAYVSWLVTQFLIPWVTFTSDALALSSMLWVIHHKITLFTYYNHNDAGSKLGYYIPLPFGITLSSMFSKLNKNSYASSMALSISHVASSGIKCFHRTFT